MHPLQQPYAESRLRERLTRWRLPLTLLCLAVAALAFLWALPGPGLFRSVAASPHRSTTPRTKPIEQIVPGDPVLARDPETGETRARKVLRVFRNVSDHLRLLTIRTADGTIQVLRTTDGHPFWVVDRGWTAAAELKIGDNLAQADGQPATLVATTYEAHPEGVPIFNFEVEGFHTYFVAAHGTRAPPIFIHNTSPGSNLPDWARQGLDDLARFRAELGPIPGGGTANGGVVARLDVGGRSFYGINAHGQPITLRMNPIARTHAEADVFQQAFNAGVRGGRGRLFVDAKLCKSCGRSGAVRSMARQLGLESLEVITPSGVITIIP